MLKWNYDLFSIKRCCCSAVWIIPVINGFTLHIIHFRKKMFIKCICNKWYCVCKQNTKVAKTGKYSNLFKFWSRHWIQDAMFTLKVKFHWNPIMLIFRLIWRHFEKMAVFDKFWSHHWIQDVMFTLEIEFRWNPTMLKFRRFWQPFWKRKWRLSEFYFRLWCRQVRNSILSYFHTSNEFH